MGHGLAVEASLEVPAGSLAWWGTRLERYGFRAGGIETHFGDRSMAFIDPHGLRVALVEPGRAIERPFTPWDGSAVPAERQVRGLHGAKLWERSALDTAGFLKHALGFRELGRDGDWTRYGFVGAPGVVDLRDKPGERRGAWGVGAVHHLAWAVADEDEQLHVRQQIEEVGGRATEVIDRFWFKSVYFKEPGGVLFEIATEGPGFAVDENPAHLGESLVLPPWFESARDEIEAGLPPLTLTSPDEPRVPESR
jgi:glyoxalase family protein